MPGIQKAAALVMMGIYPEAEEWLAVACHAMAYRIHPEYGLHGENDTALATT